MVFEGAEKLLEISFCPPYNERSFSTWPSSPSVSDDEEIINNNKDVDIWKPKHEKESMGLRVIGRETWQSMLNLVKCQILSMISNEHADAYLLSESSLFVYPHKVILKTCGTTTLLLALPRLLELAVEACGVKKIKSLFYSRKSFRYPESQPWPHCSWQDEVDVLDGYFDNGASYVMGNTISEHWYLYVVDERPIPNDFLHFSSPTPYSSQLPSPSFSLNKVSYPFSLSTLKDEKEDRLLHEGLDHTLEILMTGLCPQQMRRYFYSDSKDSEALHHWIPGLVTDSFQFDPCGWSQNGLVKSVYTTIHVTPESECSYASFETNLPQPDSAMIQSILNLFKPTKVTITLFIQRQQSLLPSSVPSMVLLQGYQLVDLMINVLPKHYLFYGHYLLEDSDK